LLTKEQNNKENTQQINFSSDNNIKNIGSENKSGWKRNGDYNLRDKEKKVEVTSTIENKNNGIKDVSNINIDSKFASTNNSKHGCENFDMCGI
jgi:hypothetical protein